MTHLQPEVKAVMSDGAVASQARRLVGGLYLVMMTRLANALSTAYQQGQDHRGFESDALEGEVSARSGDSYC